MGNCLANTAAATTSICEGLIVWQRGVRLAVAAHQVLSHAGSYSWVSPPSSTWARLWSCHRWLSHASAQTVCMCVTQCRGMHRIPETHRAVDSEECDKECVCFTSTKFFCFVFFFNNAFSVLARTMQTIPGCHFPPYNSHLVKHTSADDCTHVEPDLVNVCM